MKKTEIETIPARLVRQGSRVQWMQDGFLLECVVGTVHLLDETTCRFYAQGGDKYHELSADTDVVVLEQPQPEEPKEIGFWITVAGDTFVRVREQDEAAWQLVPTLGSTKNASARKSWRILCNRGQIRYTEAPVLGAELKRVH